MRGSGGIPKDVLAAIQMRAARGAISPSSMRGGGSKGVVDAGRRFLGGLKLSGFGTTQQSRFARALDEATDGLCASFPSRARHWGLARKGLNIFLRNCLYTVYLRDAYSLELAEAFFEVPLDFLTGTELYRASAQTLPRWATIRGLTPEASALFQTVAASVAGKRRIARVHLDAVWWGDRARLD